MRREKERRRACTAVVNGNNCCGRCHSKARVPNARCQTVVRVITVITLYRDTRCVPADASPPPPPPHLPRLETRPIRSNIERDPSDRYNRSFPPTVPRHFRCTRTNASRCFSSNKSIEEIFKSGKRKIPRETRENSTRHESGCSKPVSKVHRETYIWSLLDSREEKRAKGKKKRKEETRWTEGGEKKAKNRRGGARTKGDGAKKKRPRGRSGFETRLPVPDEKSVIIIIIVELATIINHH